MFYLRYPQQEEEKILSYPKLSITLPQIILSRLLYIMRMLQGLENKRKPNLEWLNQTASHRLTQYILQE